MFKKYISQRSVEIGCQGPTDVRSTTLATLTSKKGGGQRGRPRIWTRYLFHLILTPVFSNKVLSIHYIDPFWPDPLSFMLVIRLYSLTVTYEDRYRHKTVLEHSHVEARCFQSLNFEPFSPDRHRPEAGQRGEAVEASRRL